jgi:hypothetical protein
MLLFLMGCAGQKPAHPLGNTTGPVYETAEQIQSMPPCKAVVVEKGPCYVYLRAANGEGFYLGSPGSNAEVAQFLEGLKEGRTYRFPETFLQYQKQRRGAG